MAEDVITKQTPLLAQQNPTPQQVNQTQPEHQPIKSIASDQPKNRMFKKVLLIIAAIIILIALIFAGFFVDNQLNIKKRDNTRKADILKLRDALEESRKGSLNQTYYPSAITPATLEKEGYIEKIPTDPTNAVPYVYTYLGSPSPCAGGCTGYTLTACLENKNDKGENTASPKSACTTRTYEVSGP